MNVFQENLEKILAEGLGCLQSFSSFAKHSDMKRYYSVLEEWEELEESSESNHENNVINPEECINEDLKVSLEKKIKELFS